MAHQIRVEKHDLNILSSCSGDQDTYPAFYLASNY